MLVNIADAEMFITTFMILLQRGCSPSMMISRSAQDSLAEWSKALAPGASPQGRGFEPHSCHFSCMPRRQRSDSSKSNGVVKNVTWLFPIT